MDNQYSNKIKIDLKEINNYCSKDIVSEYRIDKLAFEVLFWIFILVFLFGLNQVIQNIVSNSPSIFYNFVTIVSFLFIMYLYYLIKYVSIIPKNLKHLSLNSGNNIINYFSATTLEVFINELKHTSTTDQNDTTLLMALYESLTLAWIWQELKLNNNTKFSDQINGLEKANNRENILIESFNNALENSYTSIECENILFGLVKINLEIQKLFTQFEISLDDLNLIISSKKINRNRLEAELVTDTELNDMNTANSEMTSLPTPNLNKFSLDLSILAGEGKFEKFIGRGDIVNQALNVLEKPAKANLMIVGPSGVGKTSMVEELASLLTARNIPSHIRHKRVVLFKYEELLSISKTTEEFEQKFTEILKEVRETKNVILYFDNIEHLISETALQTSVINLLSDELGLNDIQIIISTSEVDFKHYFERNTNFIENLTVVHLPEADQKTSTEICEIISRQLEKKYKVEITYYAITTLVELSGKYIYDKYMPRKAIDILENIVSENTNAKIIDADLVKSYLSKLTSIPLSEIDPNESDKLQNLENALHNNVISQDHAVTAIANAIRRARTGLKNDKRPIASFLFYGPTGTGKTETAKTLAKSYFGSEDAMIRFDMSEYQLQDSLQVLISKLCDEIKHHPFCLILMDEFEKADKNILNIMLQILEDARLTNSDNEVINFSNTIIICTSNAASGQIYTLLDQGKTIDEIETETKDVLISCFSPELLNRFDSIILFKPLSDSDLDNICRLLLTEVSDNLSKKHYEVSFDDNVIKELVASIDNRSFGARPLRRLIQDKIEDNIAQLILSNHISVNNPTTISSLEQLTS